MRPRSRWELIEEPNVYQLIPVEEETKLMPAARCPEKVSAGLYEVQCRLLVGHEPPCRDNADRRLGWWTNRFEGLGIKVDEPNLDMLERLSNIEERLAKLEKRARGR